MVTDNMKCRAAQRFVGLVNADLVETISNLFQEVYRISRLQINEVEQLQKLWGTEAFVQFGSCVDAKVREMESLGCQLLKNSTTQEMINVMEVFLNDIEVDMPEELLYIPEHLAG